MAKKTLSIRQFSGAIGTVGEKKDVEHSAKFMKNLNPFEDPSYVTLARQTTKVSGSTVDGLVHWADDASPHATDRFFYDSQGKIYKETSGGTWSELRNVSGAAGEGLKVFDNYLYYATGTTLGRYGLLDGTPSFDDDFLTTNNYDDDPGSSASGGGTGAADYVPPTTISESATARQTFTPTRDPLKSITIDVDDAGTGDWTITVHDADNTEIGTSTITNGNMSTGDIAFTFSSPLRMMIGNTYHFHVTSTVADGGVDTDTATDLEGAEFSTQFGILIDTDWHPMVAVEDTLIIGNERYLATWDGATHNPNKITFEAGFEVRAIARFEEFIVAAAIKGASISEAEAARLYFWDAIALGDTISYNFYVEVPLGAPSTVVNHKGALVGVYGNKGRVAVGHEPFKTVVDEIPKLTRGKKVEVYPGAISASEGSLLIGVSASTDDSSGLEQGVYEYNAQHFMLQEAFNFPYTISTGTTQGTSLKIGCVKSFGTDIYIGWRDNTNYGVDKIALGDSASASGSYESLVFDGGDPDKDMLPMNLVVTFEALTTGQGVTPKYKLDRASSFTNGTAASTVGDTRVEWPIYTRCKEIEFGFDLASTSNTFPEVTSVSLEYDDLNEERVQ